MHLIKSFFRDCLRFESVSGNEAAFVCFVQAWAEAQGFQTDLWETNESSLAGDPLLAAKHLPLAGRPTLVIKLPGTGNGPSLMFNAHSDVVAAPDADKWRVGPWAGEELDGRFIGRGACDVKGPLVAALWTMLRLKGSGTPLPGDVLLELVPGEEDCVGLGTLTSVHRGYNPAGLVVLEPTENQPRPASRGGCRFEITCRGRAVHGTVKWLGHDAIVSLRRVLDLLDTTQADWNDMDEDPLFSTFPFARPITVDTIAGGTWQGMVCDRATCAGYLELLPDDNRAFWRERFAQLVVESSPNERITVKFTEDYPGHRTPTDSAICVAANLACGGHVTWAGFNSGCESGLRAERSGTPTLVWGPGSLACAHAIDESIGWAEIEQAADLFERFTKEWFALPVSSPATAGEG